MSISTKKTLDRLNAMKDRVRKVQKDLPQLENQLLTASSDSFYFDGRFVFYLETQEGLYQHFFDMQYVSWGGCMLACVRLVFVSTFVDAFNFC